LEIKQEGLFKLDVDDDIWQDIGLTDDVDNLQGILDWLGDERARDGIKALLERDWCIEEEWRLIQERLSMQQWMQEKWMVVEQALQMASDDPDVVYQLNKQQEHLLRLCVRWQSAVGIIPVDWNGLEWGPSQIQLSTAQEYENTEQVLEGIENDDGSGDEDKESDEDYEEAELLANLESMALEESYRT